MDNKKRIEMLKSVAENAISMGGALDEFMFEGYKKDYNILFDYRLNSDVKFTYDVSCEDNITIGDVYLNDTIWYVTDGTIENIVHIDKIKISVIKDYKGAIGLTSIYSPKVKANIDNFNKLVSFGHILSEETCRKLEKITEIEFGNFARMFNRIWL